MCLTTEALALFLNLLDPQIILTGSGQITIHAAERTAVWVMSGDNWCTEAPQAGRLARAQ